MPDSIKVQIVKSQLLAMKQLEDNGTVRKVTRGSKLFVNESVRPSIQLYIGDEHPFGKSDNRGRTYHFDLCWKLLNEDARDVAGANDLIVPQMQAIAESNIQVGGLATIVTGGNELPFVSETNEPLGGVLLLYTVEYRRLLGDPYTTY